VSAGRLLAVVAAGSSPAARVTRDRADQLALGAAQLLVQVAARGPGGAGAGPPWFPVGEVPAAGAPVGARHAEASEPGADQSPGS
jgi:hypothetical protein